LLAGKLPLVILVVVEVGIMCLNTVQQKVTCLLKEWVDGKVQCVKRRVRGELGWVTSDLVE
jgi:hypothetical protein